MQWPLSPDVNYLTMLSCLFLQKIIKDQSSQLILTIWESIRPYWYDLTAIMLG